MQLIIWCFIFVINLDYFVKIFSDCFLLLAGKKEKAGGKFTSFMFV